ncbi:N-formylglutamate amidohydrolase [Aquisediminimonas profunda]|uniref:N-formylglutamate amidohydrolase n=1 Tax=Aquisediminimonas profunda TaxID=1550733 RepID=UPI001C626982|nr:N-formylglutamate amidohydrolase [Aquisediminimonas profunda]
MITSSKMVNPPFVQFGMSDPKHPLLITVPHGGRDYPPGLALLSRLPVAQLKSLEDRFADLLIEGAVSAGHAALVAKVPRVWVDLNRNEREFDPGLVSGPEGVVPLASAKVRGGLGVVPRRVVRGGDIWRGRLSEEAFEARLSGAHRPWHAHISESLEARFDKFGVAVLLDVHSMPPLPLTNDEQPAPHVVIGDLFGRSARGQYSRLALQVAERHRFVARLNTPYAGGHILERHSQPARGIHALQVEIDRSLYLDAALDQPGPGLARCRAFLADLADTLSDEALCAPVAVAAE